jgi:DNA polymerase-3 subunit beta
MKVLCDRERLREGMALATSVIPVKSTRPAIENVCLTATDDSLELVGTDLEVALRYRIEDVKVERPGKVLVPARVASDFVRDLGGETASLEVEGDHCTITSGSDRCELVTIDPDEFPVVDRFSDEGTLSLQAGNFTKLVNRTAFAAAREQGRYAMHGILTLVEEEQLRMVATDGRRLAVTSIPLEAGKGMTHRAIVPTKGMQLFCRVIGDPLEQVKIQFGDNRLGLKTSQAEVFARLIDGEFPRYSAVIPEEGQNVIEADADLFARKLRLVSNVTSQDTRAVRLSFGKGQMTIFGKSTGYGEASAEMEVDVKGDAEDVAYNPDYLMDGIKNCEADLVRLEYSERTSPGKFTLGENYVYIVMPITIDS